MPILPDGTAIPSRDLPNSMSGIHPCGNSTHRSRRESKSRKTLQPCPSSAERGPRRGNIVDQDRARTHRHPAGESDLPPTLPIPAGMARPPHGCPKGAHHRHPRRAGEGGREFGGRVDPESETTRHGARDGHEGGGRGGEQGHHRRGEETRHVEEASILQRPHQHAGSGFVGEWGPHEEPIGQDALGGRGERARTTGTKRAGDPSTAGEADHSDTVSRVRDGSGSIALVRLRSPNRPLNAVASPLLVV